KDHFLAMLAHELRNPLAPVRNALEVLRSPGATGDQRETARAMMERQVDHLTRLVDDLLDVSRVTQDRIELRPERTELRDVVTRAVEIAEPVITARQHALQLDLPAE